MCPQLVEALCILSPSAEQQLTGSLYFPAVSTLQVHRAEGGFARPNANNKLTNKTENRCCPAGEVWLERSGGSCRAAEETGREVTGLTAVPCQQCGPAVFTVTPGGVGFISLMPVLYFSVKTRLGISLQESLFLSHTHTVVCASGRELLSESLAGASKQLLPNLSKGFHPCRIIECCSPHSTTDASDLRGLSFPPQVSINLGLVYKVQQHTGIIFQFLAFSRRRQRVVPEILAAGGRYDLLVSACPLCVD